MPADDLHQTSARSSDQRAPLAWWLVTLVPLGLGVLMLAWGPGGNLSQRILGVTVAILSSAWQPVVYMLGALGIGRIIRQSSGTIGQRLAIQLGVGLTLTLSLTHGLGVLGLLNTVSAWFISGVGLALLLHQLSRLTRSDRCAITSAARRVRSPIGLMCISAAVLAVLMSSNPPGVLWDSEYGGYDALSYHLQLPAEWIQDGQIWPNSHNVYSFLPGYIEGAFAHLALLSGGDMQQSDARAAFSAQYLALLMLLSSALVIGLLSESVWERLYASSPPLSLAPFAWLLTLSTPWLMVVGTLAYNDISLVLLGGIALLIALSQDLNARNRFLLAALVVGGACCCKPTAIFMLAPGVGVVLLATTPLRRWVLAMAIGLLVGSLTILPWLIRNEIAIGNPVFPQLGSVFGYGNWTPSQHETYQSAHHFDGSLLERIRLIALPDPSGGDHVSRFRGLSNLQWGITPSLGLIGIMVLIARRSTRRGGLVVIGSGLITLVSWMMLTHIQSRFLIPIAPLLIVCGALVIGMVPAHRLIEPLGVLIGFISLLWCGGVALSQNHRAPFAIVDLGPGVFMGAYDFDALPWTARVDRIRQNGDEVYLLGDATPFYITGPVRYNTVYDHWLLEDVIEESGELPEQWTEGLRKRGITLVVVSFSEIDRFAASGWLPEGIEPDRLISWINTLPEPIDVEQDPRSMTPIRAVFRIDQPHP